MKHRVWGRGLTCESRLAAGVLTVSLDDERDPTLYDRGYQFDSYDLVVLTIEDLHETVRALCALHLMTRATSDGR